MIKGWADSPTVARSPTEQAPRTQMKSADPTRRVDQARHVAGRRMAYVTVFLTGAHWRC